MPREFAVSQEKQSDKKTLKDLEGKDKEREEKYKQAAVAAKKGDAKTFNQLSSSGKAAQDKRQK